MLYDINLTITYTYEVPASGGRHVVRVLPLSLPNRQRLVAGTVSFKPAPEERSDSVDFFANPATSIVFRSAHDKLVIRMQARVQLDIQPLTADFSPPLSDFPAEIANIWSTAPDSPHHFLGQSPLLPEDPLIAAYTLSIVKPGMTIRQIATAICERIHRDFTYDPKATTVETPPREAFKLKRGVCQDFTHVMITALRSLGIPAGYVSGFLRTIPPPGKERLEGADAMHAWVRFWCGRAEGWMELDPTNNIFAGADHIVVGHGRDYSDVAPVIGVLKSYGSHETEQAVDVLPLG
ncbi:transglutaminase-like putative cysteine protease [Pararhizobium capsulatum DSM 1112]|uniref:Transglutaminase-like putative cysteine protease n=1 Tax=Pararhizobium capsulatum DSM 1112 TaxID=1121113 RepID=A0ABU0BV47_9HYPH|nr:transglutaminase family protein [Pararhizobium capsulatum]MDQ0321857.1 transglutaminase-like putative cysteine protease [Pararhizobium capsulatum DSM 1112]